MAVSSKLKLCRVCSPIKNNVWLNLRILNDRYIEQVEHFQLSASSLLQITTNRVLHPSHCTLVVVNVAGGFTDALPHNMLLQFRRVCSLEFLPVAVLEVGSPSATIPFRMTG